MGSRYINTDLEIVSSERLTALPKEIETARGTVLAIHQRPDALWHAGFEMEPSGTSPDETIQRFLACLEGMGDEAKAELERAQSRELNIGFETRASGTKLEHHVAPETLIRAAKLGLGVGITIYPGEPL